MTSQSIQEAAGYRISPVQEQLWRVGTMMEAAGGKTPLAEVTVRIVHRNAINHESIWGGATALARRYEILRSTYTTAGGRRFPLQVPLESSDALVEILGADNSAESSAATPDERADALPRLAIEFLSDVEEANGSTLIRLSAPALIADVWTLLLLASELLRNAGGKGDDDDEPLQYAQFAEWSRQFVDDPDPEGVDYWKRIAERPLADSWLTWRSRCGSVSPESFPLSEEAVRRMAEIAERLQLPVEEVPVLVWGAFLRAVGKDAARYTICDLAGRDDEALATVVGPLARSVPFPLTTGDDDAEQNPTVDEFLLQLSRSLREANEFADNYPFAEGLFSRADDPDGAERIATAVEVIDARTFDDLDVLSARTFRTPVAAKLSALLRRSDASSAGGAQLDLELLVDTSLIGRDSAAVLRDMFDGFLAEIAVETARTIDQIAPMPEPARLVLQGEWESASCASWSGRVRSDFDLLRRIEQHAANDPNATAVIEGERSVSRSELNARASAVATTLVAAGVMPGTIVPLQLNRSVDAVAAILGVLKVGAAFLPIDPGLPEERRRFMIKESGAKILLVDAIDAADLEGENDLRLIPLSTIEDSSSAFDGVDVASGAPAYVIFTSGSTGLPKGCVINRGNITSYVDWSAAYYHRACGSSGAWPLFTSLSFDLTLTSIFCSLASGGLLTIYSNDREMPEVLASIFSSETPTDIVKMTPGQASLLGTLGLKRSNVKGVILGGEQLQQMQVESLRRLNGEIAIFNEYGPTETTIGCTVARIEEGEKITIGRPIDGAVAYVLDDAGAICAPYEVGELWIAGCGVGEGYLNRVELTAERFRSDLAATGGQKAYRTGDRAWRYPDGTIVYAGRFDEQVKVRGYRIEPGEIRSQLLAQPDVGDAIVVPVTSPAGETELAAYYVAGSHAVAADDLRSALARFLPDYMVPLHLLPLESIPLTVNGKPDTSCLPNPFEVAERPATTAPRTATEREIAAIWSKVLGVESIGVDDDFFKLGGHSLLAMRMIAQVNLALGTELKIQTLFENPTVAQLAVIVDGAEACVEVPVVRAQPRPDGVNEFELSDAQRRLWVLEQMDDLGAAYHIFGAYDLHGGLDLAAMERTFTRLVHRHPTLRTTFPIRDGRPVQRVNESGRINVEMIDLRETAEDRRNEEAEAIATRVLQGKFDLANERPFRVAVLRLAEGHHRLLVSMHHQVSDGWSIEIMIRELGVLYDAAVNGHEATLPELTVDYADHVERQRSELEGERGEQLRSYWHEQLAGAAPLDLPIDSPRPTRRSYQGNSATFQIDNARLRRLEEIGSESGASLFMVLVALLDTLLHRYTGVEDVTIGTAIAGRDRAELEGQIGFYVNVLPLRVRLNGEMTFNDLLAEVRRISLGAYDHQSYPFDRLVDELGIEREVGRSPLFDVFLVLQNRDVPELRFGDAALTVHPYENTSNVYDLVFNCEEIDGELHCTVSYSTDLFLPQRISNLVVHLDELINEVTAEAGRARTLSQLALVPRSSAAEMAKMWSRSEPYDGKLHRTLVDQIEEVACAAPLAEAVCSADLALTYNELRQRSNGIANYLRSALDTINGDAGMPRPIAVLLPRSGAHALLFLAIRKAGGIYVPIDSDFPEGHIVRMIEESGAAIVITDGNYPESLGELIAGRTIIMLDQLEGIITEERPNVAGEVDDVAAVFFTSGTTGRPKGVRLHEQGLINAALATVAEVAYDDDCFRSLQFASPSFDASLMSMLVALLAGGTVVSVDRETIEQRENFLAALERWNVTTAILPPTYLATLNGAEMPTMRSLCTAGEAPQTVDALRYAERHGYLNAYGPTECSICVSIHHVDPAADYRTGVPIGREIPNTIAVVVDRYGNLLPDGLDGELWVAGTGIGPGYLRDEETVRAFVEHPTLPGLRFYRTGDIVRRGFGGELQFKGRRDNQVKVRGHRVEPEAVASMIQTYPSVADATVIPYRASDGVLSLVAWIVSETPAGDEAGMDWVALRTWLADRLPSYMVPSRFYSIDALPLAATGKVDHHALSSLTDEEMARMAEAPAMSRVMTELEAVMCEGVAEVLGLAAVSPDSNFFMLGGDSIRAIQLIWKLKERGYEMKARDLFAYPLLADAASRLVPLEAAIVEERVVGDVPLHPIQQWFFETIDDASIDHFNQSTLLRWRLGTIDVAQLREALLRLVDHHDMLRAYFDRTGIVPRQIVAERGVVLLEEIDLTGEDAEIDARERFSDELRRTHAGFVIEQLPLFRAKIIRRVEEGKTVEYLHLVAHHLIIDVVSWHIVVNDLVALYQAKSEAVVLPTGSSYRSWVAAMEDVLSTSEGKRAVEERRTLRDLIDEVLLLPVGRSVPNRMGEVAIATCSLSRETTAALVSDVHHAYTTDVRDILVAALGRALRCRTGGRQVVVGLEGHGRRIDALAPLDVSRTVGWFTSLSPILLHDAASETGQDDPGYSIKQAKEALRSLSLNGAGYGIARYLDPSGERTNDPLDTHAQVTLNYLGVESGAGEELYGGLFDLDPESDSPIHHASRSLVRRTEIDILASIVDGVFTASMVHVPGRIGTAEVEEIGRLWMAEIDLLITHLGTTTAVELTPSDIDYDGLSIEGLDALLSSITVNEE